MTDIRVSTLQEEIDLELVYKEIHESYWAKGIPRETFMRSLNNSICFSIFKNEKQIGFARVVTDKATFAYLGDVFIVHSERGRGYSKILMDSIINHDELGGLRRFCLATRDAQKLYERYGFKNFEISKNWMEIKNNNVYGQ